MKFIKKNLKFTNLVVAVLSFLSFMMIFFTAVKSGDEAYSGLSVIFGHTEKTFIGELVVFKFSFFNLVTYLLILSIIGLALYGFFKNPKNKIIPLIIIGLSIITAVFFLLTKSFVVLPDSTKDLFELAGTSFSKEAQLGFGPIFAAIFMFLTAGCGITKLILDK